jgi:hypothetical protein
MAANGTNTDADGAISGQGTGNLYRQTGLPDSAWSGERDEARGRIREPLPQCRHVGVAAKKGRQDHGQRRVAQFIDGRALHRRPRAPKERVPNRTGQIQCRGQRAHGLDLWPPSFSALQGTYRVNRQARDRRELLLGETGGFPKRF